MGNGLSIVCLLLVPSALAGFDCVASFAEFVAFQ
jgi:hypothetical protein